METKDVVFELLKLV